MIKIMPIGFTNVYCDTFTCTNIADHWIGIPGDNITPDYKNICKSCVSHLLLNLPDEYKELVAMSLEPVSTETVIPQPKKKVTKDDTK